MRNTCTFEDKKALFDDIRFNRSNLFIEQNQLSFEVAQGYKRSRFGFPPSNGMRSLCRVIYLKEETVKEHHTRS